jgi:hypothetical protein
MEADNRLDLDFDIEAMRKQAHVVLKYLEAHQRRMFKEIVSTFDHYEVSVRLILPSSLPSLQTLFWFLSLGLSKRIPRAPSVADACE